MIAGLRKTCDPAIPLSSQKTEIARATCHRTLQRIPTPGILGIMHVHAAPSPAGARRTQSVLRFSLVATLAYVVVTFVFGLRAHSLALLSEAGHNASDFLALLLSFAAVYFQTRPASPSKPFG